MTSAPAANSSSACLGVMPMPPAAFSPLTTTKSAPSSSRRSASIVRATRRRPLEPTTSPTKGSRRILEAMQEERPADPGGASTRRSSDAERPAGAGEPTGHRRRRAAPVVVPRWIQLVVLPLAILGAWALLRAAGPVTLLFVVAALIALLLNPFVAFLQRARACRAGSPCWSSSSRCIVIVGGLVARARRARSATRPRPSATTSRASSTTPTPSWPTCSGGSTTRGSTSRSRRRAGPRSRRSGERVAEGSGELVTFTRDALTILIEGSIALILIVVLSVYMLLYGERIGAAVRWRGPARGRHAGRRLPDARAARRLRLRPRPAALLDHHGHERRDRAVDHRLARHLPRRQDVRGRVRRVVRLRGADPLRRAGDRRRAARADRAWSAAIRSTRCG